MLKVWRGASFLLGLEKFWDQRRATFLVFWVVLVSKASDNQSRGPGHQAVSEVQSGLRADSLTRDEALVILASIARAEVPDTGPNHQMRAIKLLMELEHWDDDGQQSAVGMIEATVHESKAALAALKPGGK